MTPTDPAPRTVPEPLWSDQRIIDAVVSTGLSYTVAIQVREDYEAELATARARIAELEAQLISVSRELVSTSNADRYYRGFNDGYAHAESRIAELEAQLAERGSPLGAEGSRWEPVPDDIYNTDGPEVIYVKEQLLSIVGETYVYLPANMRLCRRKPSSEAQP